MKNRFLKNSASCGRRSDFPISRQGTRRLILEGLEQRQLLAASILHFELVQFEVEDSTRAAEATSAFHRMDRDSGRNEFSARFDSSRSVGISQSNSSARVEATDHFFSMQFNRLEGIREGRGQPDRPGFKLPPSIPEAESPKDFDVAIGSNPGRDGNQGGGLQSSLATGSNAFQNSGQQQVVNSALLIPESGPGLGATNPVLNSSRSTQNPSQTAFSSQTAPSTNSPAFGPSVANPVSLLNFASPSGGSQRTVLSAPRNSNNTETISNTSPRADSGRSEQVTGQAINALVQLGTDMVQAKLSSTLDSASRITTVINNSVLVVNSKSPIENQISGVPQTNGLRNRFDGGQSLRTLSTDNEQPTEFLRSSKVGGQNARTGSQKPSVSNWMSSEYVSNGPSETDESYLSEIANRSPLPIPQGMVYLALRNDGAERSVINAGDAPRQLAGFNPFGIMQTVVFSHQSNGVIGTDDGVGAMDASISESLGNWADWMQKNSTTMIAAFCIYATFQWVKPAKKQSQPGSSVYQPE